MTGEPAPAGVDRRRVLAGLGAVPAVAGLPAFLPSQPHVIAIGFSDMIDLWMKGCPIQQDWTIRLATGVICALETRDRAGTAS